LRKRFHNQGSHAISILTKEHIGFRNAFLFGELDDIQRHFNGVETFHPSQLQTNF